MPNRLRTLLTVGSFVMTAGLLNADTLIGTGGAWQTWSTSQLYGQTGATPGGPYWNNDSGDGTLGNVGYCMAGGGICTVPSTPGVIPYYGTNSGGAISDMYFTSAGSPLTITLQSINTNNKNAGTYDVFGWYVGTTGAGAVLNPLLNTNAGSVGTTATLSALTAGQNYGFYIENVLGGGTASETDYYFFMSGQTGDPNEQHFAIFQAGTNSFEIGDVDSTSCEANTTFRCNPASDFDYNDVVVSVAPAAPEPATAGLLAASLLGLAILGRRRIKAISSN